MVKKYRQLCVKCFTMAAIILLSACTIGPPKETVVHANIVFPQPPDEPRFYFEQTILSSADVIAETDDQRMQRWLIGGKRGGMGMGKPFGVAVHKGRIFVSDSAARKIHVFDKSANKYLEIGLDTPGRLVKPMGLETDLEGNLYVMDATQEKVIVYNRDGEFLREFGNSDMFDKASSLTVTPDGARLYVIDTGGVKSNNHRILEFDAINGQLIKQFGTRGTGDGQFNLPKDATIGPDGLIYIVDSANFRVQVLNPADGSFVRTFGAIGRRAGQFSRPKSIDTDADGNVYVSDAAFGNFQIFKATGELLLAVGSRGGIFEPAKFMLPAGITVDEDGRVYMVDQYFKKLDIFRPASLEKNQGYFSKPQADSTTQ